MIISLFKILQGFDYHKGEKRHSISSSMKCALHILLVSLPLTDTVFSLAKLLEIFVPDILYYLPDSSFWLKNSFS
jgi:hypothetical protein